MKKVIFEEGDYLNNCTGCRTCELVCSFIHEAVIIPAALSVGENFDSSGKELLTAIVAGYESRNLKNFI